MTVIPLKMPEHNALSATRMFAIFLAAAVGVACAGAPVQEMSDARQAIAAARQAHVDDKAAADLAHAQQFLDAAQKALDAGEYSTAREDAQLARQYALRALGISQGQDINGLAPP